MTGSEILGPLLEAATPCVHFVVCPFGGASRSALRSWVSLQRFNVSASVVCYPGRDQRLHEPFMTSIEAFAGQLAQLLARSVRRHPWILVGHSIGAQVAFETCLLLQAQGCAPSGLVLSGCHAPHISPRHRLSQLDDIAFVERLIALGGCPPQLRIDDELRDLYLPLLRADFRVSESYRRALETQRATVRTATLLLYGSADSEAPRDDVEAWDKWLSGPVQLRALPGDHFYMTREPKLFVHEIAQAFQLPVSSPHQTSAYYP